jgi:hypothetical protein
VGRAVSLSDIDSVASCAEDTRCPHSPAKQIRCPVIAEWDRDLDSSFECSSETGVPALRAELFTAAPVSERQVGE